MIIKLKVALAKLKKTSFPVNFQDQYQQILAKLERRTRRFSLPLVFAPALLALLFMLSNVFYNYNIMQKKEDLLLILNYEQNLNENELDNFIIGWNLL
jgi:hypothetical protein